MKIPLFIIAFLLTGVSLCFGQSYSIVKGSAYSVAIENIVIEVENSKNNARVFDGGNQIHLTEPWGISATKEKSRGHIFFSNKMHVWLGGTTTLWIDNFEQFIDKDENNKTIIDDGSFVANFRLNGSADFKLKSLSETGYFNILSNGADLNVRSKWFYVLTEKNFTTIECYEGTISLTNSDTMKETVVKEGERAVVWGKDGEMNLSVEITKLTDEQREAAKKRLTGEDLPEWSFVSPSPKTP